MLDVLPASAKAPLSWDDCLDRLIFHVVTEGALPENGGSEEQSMLAQWLRQARRDYMTHRLPAGRWDRLQSAPELISNLFTPNDPLGAQWCAHVEELVSFVAANGRLPKSNVEAEVDLYGFLTLQLRYKRHGALSAQRAQVLRGLPDPIGDKFKPSRETWEVRASELIDFTRQNGRLPARRIEEESGLAQWMYRQTERQRTGSLPTAKAARLSESHKDLAVLFSTSTPGEAKWERSLAAINEHAHRTGKAPSRSSEFHEERKLWRWLVTQLTAQRNGKLSDQRLERLRAAHPVISVRFNRQMS